MMLNTLDRFGFIKGSISSELVTDSNRSLVVEVEVPELVLGQFELPCWVNGEWVARADYRGHSWYNPANTDEVHSPVLPDDACPEGWVYWAPGENKVVTQAEAQTKAWNGVRAKRNMLLSQSDWTDTASAPARLGESLYEAWQAYRQALRDVTEQASPFDVVWPVAPG